ncbi:PilZ domain-containing protein [Aurantiacibacter rhizosphaerae]|uniref:PilZ domain-containing protein n=1 Tax=Aurantiacibacter rhizosphaerae TaxID=2691582 RepID=A0A844XD03_9SPHN|nr:PilZ domain-containing protein [Aurantiacibacter rhizosphaerae]MWV27643.1 hypothetical protein [Aurantiacibacter rhizosphaerae]
MPAADTKSRASVRETVMLRAKVVDSRGTHEAQISDISSHGMLGTMANPPERGEFISVHFPGQELGGQVRWVNGRKFGVYLRERVDAKSLTSGRRQARKAVTPAVPQPAEEMSLKSMIITYSVLCLTALSAAYLIVTYIIL